jgi:hypothetical protein
VSPLSLTDAELETIRSLAAAVPIEHRDNFLRAVADAISKYPEGGRGPGLMHREAAKLQRQFMTAAPGPAPRSRAWCK